MVTYLNNEKAAKPSKINKTDITESYTNWLIAVSKNGNPNEPEAVAEEIFLKHAQGNGSAHNVRSLATQGLTLIGQVREHGFQILARNGLELVDKFRWQEIMRVETYLKQEKRIILVADEETAAELKQGIQAKQHGYIANNLSITILSTATDCIEHIDSLTAEQKAQVKCIVIRDMIGLGNLIYSGVFTDPPRGVQVGAWLADEIAGKNLPNPKVLLLTDNFSYHAKHELHPESGQDVEHLGNTKPNNYDVVDLGMYKLKTVRELALATITPIRAGGAILIYFRL